MSDTRKRSRKRFGGHARKKQRGSRELEVGAQGVLVTCNMNERKCTSETFRLLSEYADALYGPEQHTDSLSEDEEGEEDAEAALQKEVSQIRSSMKSHQQRFTAVDSGANNVLFIRTHGVDPEKLVHHILLDLHQTKKRKSRVILRMLPVSGTCRAFPEDMEKFLSEYLERWFKAPLRATYKICFKARNSSHNKRDDVIKAVAGLVDKMNPLNKVDLSNPELSIIIEIIKSVCCVSVVRDYMLLRKYNLQEVARESGGASAEGAREHACAEGAREHACAEGAREHACAEGAREHACAEGAREHACAEGAREHACAESGDASNGNEQTEIQ